MPHVCSKCKQPILFEAIRVNEDWLCEICFTQTIIAGMRADVTAQRLAVCGIDRGRYAKMRFTTYAPENDMERATFQAIQQAIKVQPFYIWLHPAEVVPGNGNRNLQKSYTGYGCGKTHLGVAILARAAEHGQTIAMANVPDLVKAVQATYSDKERETEADLIESLLAADVLLLDDFGAESVRPESLNWLRQIMYGLFNGRYIAEKSMIVTTNLTRAATRELLGDRTMSRVAEMFRQPYPIQGRDRRIGEKSLWF